MQGTQEKRTFTYEEVPFNTLTSTDLRKEAIEAGANGIPWIKQQVFRITIGDQTERAEALYLPEWNRLGIAWGADATWADVADLESGIEMWLNSPDEWEQHN